MSEVADTYVAKRVADGSVSSHSARSVRSVLRRFVEGVGDRPPRTLRPSHVASWLASDVEATQVTLASRYSVVHAFCRWMVVEGIIATDPSALVPRPGPPARARGRKPAPIPPHLANGPLAAYAQAQRRRYLSPRTISGQRRTLVAWALYLHPRDVTEATSTDVEEWLDTRRLGVGGARAYLSTLRAFYAWAEHDGRVLASPARDVVMPRNQRLVPHPIADDDLALALTGADARMKAWLCLGAYQGLRVKEIAGLRTSDVLFDAMPPVLIVHSGKGGHQREVPLNPNTSAALRVFGLPGNGFVFCSDDGRAYRAETVGSYIGRYLHSLGIPSSAHCLRHWFGTKLYQATRDLRLVQELLGHAHPSTTAIYTRPSVLDGVTAVVALDVGHRAGEVAP